VRTVARTICTAVFAVLILAAAATVRGGDAPEPPKLRLPAVARPTAYTVELTIDPSKEGFTGSISIDMTLARTVSLLWLNAKELNVESASASHGGQSTGVRTISGGEEFTGFAFDRPVGPGRLLLSIRYRGPLRQQSSAGLFKQKDGAEWYVYSQFEATDARRAFPCFDEPSYKTPWQLTLRIPAGAAAVSNTPILSESSDADGQKTIRFRRTPPLPSYLVALGVGPFAIVDAGRWGARKTPVRIVVPRGREGETRWAVEMTGPLLERLEGYFGTPFPFEKLDEVAIPQTTWWGAMENAGLIMTNAASLLAGRSEDTFFFRRSSSLINAHEMAHQWFGDLVTLSWWDDIWLNESFAEWLSRKLVRAWKPEWRLDEWATAGTTWTMRNDTLASARQIRQPILSNDDIANSFDAITYTKGAAVLEMFELWIGERRFQASVRSYLAGKRWGNATASDFLHALDSKGAQGAAAALETFLDQSGVPLLRIGLDCQAGRPPRVLLSQKRLASAWAGSSEPRLWRVPVCLRIEAGLKAERVCRLLTSEAEAFELPKWSCPDRVVSRVGGVGYYRASYTDELFARIVDAGAGTMSSAERAVFVNDVGALAAGGGLPPGTALDLVPRFAGDRSPYVLSGLYDIVDDVRRDLLPEDLRPKFSRFLQRHLGERARAIGFAPRPGEDDEARFLRRVGVVELVASDGDDATLRAEARRLAEAWIADPKAVDADVIGPVLSAFPEWGDRVLFEECRTAAKKTAEPRERRRLLDALASFRDPALAREAVELLVKGELEPMDAQGFAFSCGYSDPCRTALWNAVRADFDGILRRLPPDVAGYVPTLFSFCSKERQREVEEFLRPRVEKLPGGPRNLDQTVEAIGLCSARKAAQEPDLRAFFEKY
jgi:alanyl aminopeptidase